MSWFWFCWSCLVFFLHPLKACWFGGRWIKKLCAAFAVLCYLHIPMWWSRYAASGGCFSRSAQRCMERRVCIFCFVWLHPGRPSVLQPHLHTRVASFSSGFHHSTVLLVITTNSSHNSGQRLWTLPMLPCDSSKLLFGKGG